MSKLELHPETADHIRSLSEALPQGVILKGTTGSGLFTIARQIAGNDLVSIIRPTMADGAIAEEGSGEIRVAQIRELNVQTRGISTTRHVFIIDNADRMNARAQNAFLKLLEEPTDRTHYLLTAHSPQRLLPTVLSRVQQILVKPLSREQSLQFIEKQGKLDKRQMEQVLFLAHGLPAEIIRLIESEKYFEQSIELVSDARQLLSGTVPERIHIAQKYHSNRIGAQSMLAQAIRILEVTLGARPTSKAITTIDQLTDVYDQIGKNGNVRLSLLGLVV